MILIADSGSTKTDWAAVADGMVQHRIQTEGINPFVQTDDEILSILSSLISQLGDDGISRASVFFYGAGVRGEMAERMQGLLGRFFSSDVAVASDLLGAARALFGKCEGIACILGTGSNSGLYDGCRIVENTPPLGYILGDEGSGAVLGRLFINALFKHRLPDSLREEFLSDTGQDMEDPSRLRRAPGIGRGKLPRFFPQESRCLSASRPGSFCRGKRRLLLRGGIS